MGASFWSPLFLAVASGAFAIISASTRGWNVGCLIAAVMVLVFIAAAYVAAKRTATARPKAGEGGNAEATGVESIAEGGDGGRGPYGGRGGDAFAGGKGSRAKGGRGGDT